MKGGEIHRNIPTQHYAFLKDKVKSNAASASLVLSAMTTGFVGTVISWDLDTSGSKRKMDPDFYAFMAISKTTRRAGP